MSDGVLGGLLDSQVGGALVGRALSATMGSLGAPMSAAGALSEGIGAGIHGLMEGIHQLMPGRMGSGSASAGTASSAGQSIGGPLAGAQMSSGGGMGSGSASVGTASPAGQSIGGSLAGAQMSGAIAGQALGPAASLGQSIPAGNWFGDSGSKGILGSTGALTPNVGGILFDQCARGLAHLEQIDGAYWDSELECLVIVGREASSPEFVKMRMEGVGREHLAVALRASVAGQSLGVSIDPPAEYREGMKKGQTPPEGTPMLVSYLGQTEDTSVGAIMFEADRLLKSLDKGVDNQSRKPIRVSVRGYRPLLQMITPGGERVANVWHRFWIVIDDVEIREDKAIQALTFGKVRLKVLNETELDGSAGTGHVDPIDEEFTQHITEHYDEYGKDFPVLMRLKEIAKASALAKYLCSHVDRLDFGSILTTPIGYVDTPKTTPGISVVSPNSQTEHRGNAIVTRTVSLFGGVDLDVEPRISQDSGDARHLRDMAYAARPSISLSSWLLPSEAPGVSRIAKTRPEKHEGSRRALATRLGTKQSSFHRLTQDDSMGTGPRSQFLALKRIYDSGRLEEGDFGPGWRFWVPYALTIVSRSGKRQEVLTTKDRQNSDASPHIIVLHDNSRFTTAVYRPAKREADEREIRYCKVQSQSTAKGKSPGISYTYDPKDYVLLIQNCFKFVTEDFVYLFDNQGNLEEIDGRDGQCVVRYTREDGRVVGVSGAKNEWYKISYDGHRILNIMSSSGKQSVPNYDVNGYLACMMNSGGYSEKYGYDVRGRLSQVRNDGDKVVQINVYDDFGCIVKSPDGPSEDVVTANDGSLVTRTFNKGVLEEARDGAGGHVKLTYADRFGVSRLSFSGASCPGYEANYDQVGRLSSFSDRAGSSWRMLYDAGGCLKEIVRSNGEKWSLQNRTDGSTQVDRMHGGIGTRYTFDAHGRPMEVSISDGQQWSFKHCEANEMSVSTKDTKITACASAKGVTVTRRANGRVKETLVFGADHESPEARPRGLKFWRRPGIDASHRYARLRLKSCKRDKFSPSELAYGEDGCIIQVRSHFGEIAYHTDEANLTLDVSFGTAK